MLLEALSVGVAVVRYPECVFEHANPRLAELAGALDLDDLLARAPSAFYPDRSTRRTMEVLSERVRQQGKAHLKDVPYKRLDGLICYHDVFGQRVDRGDGRQRIIWTHVNTTERRQREHSLRSLGRLREALLANTAVGIHLVRYPERIIIEANQALLEILGYNDEDGRLVGQPSHVLFASAGEDQRKVSLAREVLENGSGHVSGVQIKRRDGEIRCLDMHGRRLDVTETDHPVIVWTSVDVTERHMLTQQLHRQALFDPLTGLPNRRALTQHLSSAFARSKRLGTTLALGLLDLDDFKPVNDRFGHAAGDTLLTQLAERLRDSVRDSDFVARLGGDEFVVVLEGIDSHATRRQLDPPLSRLHTAVETDFDLGGARTARVSMTMGLALYPRDGDNLDALLRCADSAMYQAKGNKATRTRWWQLGETSLLKYPAAKEFDPFGTEASQLLTEASGHIAATVHEFAGAFYQSYAERSGWAPWLSSRNSQQQTAFQIEQERHLDALFSPAAKLRDVRRRAWQIGSRHALMGLSGTGLSEATSNFSDRLRKCMEDAAPASRSRYQILYVADMRLRLDMQIQLRAIQQTMDRYYAHNSRPFVSLGSWASLAQAEIDALAKLPGIRACELLRPQAQGIFAVELSAGPVARQIVEALHQPAMVPILDSRHPAGQGLVNAAWRTGQVQRSDAYGFDYRTRQWHEALTPLGVQSMLALPVASEHGAEMVIAIQGAYAHRFSASWIQAFIAALMQRWERLASLPRQPTKVLRQEQAERYRALLHSDGFRLFVQPIVDIRSGMLTKVEALARLQDHTGCVFEPHEFLPALRDPSLDALFRAGLQQGLQYLRRWHSSGLDIGLTVNLPPSTLMHPKCAGWVQDALSANAIEPGYLTLELIETQAFEEISHECAVNALKALGVKLAIDDLGSGYSSLRRLIGLPFDVIKIDQALTRDIALDPVKALRLLRTIIQVSRDFAREVVVEGVENPSLMEATHVLGASYGQGHFISPPMPAAQLPDWVSHRPASASRRTDLPVTTFLGALASHWDLVFDQSPKPPNSYADCPLTRLLPGDGAASPDPALWHRQSHESADEQERANGRHELTRWLVKQIKADLRSTGSPPPQ